MVRRKSTSIEIITARLVGGSPIAAHRRADGTLVVLDPQGRKLSFTPEEIRQAEKKDEQLENEPEEAQ